MYNHPSIKILLVFFIVSFFFYADAQTSERSCRIKSIVGTAKIRRGSTINWRPARANMPVKEHDALRTFIESEIELETSEGTIIKIGENSTLEMATFKQSEQSKTTKVKIMNGKVAANVKKLMSNRSEFEFETPTATAAIRGTTVGFEVNKNITIIKVFEGSVLVKPWGSKASAELKDNQMTSVAKGQKKIIVEKLTEKSSLILPLLESSDTTIVDTSSTVDTANTVVDSITPTGEQQANDSLNTESSGSDSTDFSSEDDTTSLNTQPESDSLYQLQLNSDTLQESNVETSQNIPVRITLSSPVDGSIIKPLSQISVGGTVSPIQASITVNGKTVPVNPSGTFKTSLSAPAIGDDFELIVTASNDGSTQSITRILKIESTDLQFNVINPTEGQVIKKTSIQVSGTVTPGAEVTAMSIRLPVTPTGSFSGQVPIPNEEGEIFLEFEASLNGKYQNITRKITFEPEYRFSLLSPQEGQEVTSTSIQIRGEVLPAHASVSVLGRSLTVSPTGIFSGLVVIPDEEGEIELDFEISSGLMFKTENKKITYKKPRDIIRPAIQAALPLVSDQERLTVAVYDRTPDDEITFYYEVDGEKESETGSPNSSFYLPLRAGMHKYTVYAVDKAGNQSSVLSQTISWFGNTSWSVKPDKISDILHLPPSGPDKSYKPVYSVNFSIENLPDNDMRLIGAVTVVNKTNGDSKTKKIFTDNYFSVDIELKNHTANIVDIIVEDIQNKTIVKTLTITVK